MIDNPNFYDIDAERAVIGAALLDNSCIETLRGILSPSDFYNVRNIQLWPLLLDMSHDKKPIDLISLTDEIRVHGLNVEPSYTASLSESTPSAANVEYYAKIVKDKSLKRQSWTMLSESAEQLKTGNKTGIEIANDIESQAAKIATSNKSAGYTRMGCIISSTLERFDFYTKHSDELMGITSGFKSIDNITDGFRQDDYIIIGARPSCGKTALFLTMADNMSIEKDIPVGIFSAEMSKELLNERQIFGLSGVSKKRIKFGHLSKMQMGGIEDACKKIYKAPMFIDDTPNISLSNFRASARKMIYSEGAKIIFIDYAGLIDAERPKLARWEQMSYVSRELKAFARENKVPVVALAQLRRESEGKKPSLADLRDSGSFEQDGDTIFFLHRPKEAELNAEVIETELICAKQRNGPVGTIMLNFYPELVKFADKE